MIVLKFKLVITSNIWLLLLWIQVDEVSKEYLKKHDVRDWLTVIASNKDPNVYELRYFNIAEKEGKDDEWTWIHFPIFR